MRRKLTIFSEKAHMLIHVLIGLAITLFMLDTAINETDISVKTAVILGLIASLAPDVEHIIFYYTYGKKTQYSKIVKEMLRHKQIKTYLKFCQKNHKQNQQLFLHNFFTILAAGLIGYATLKTNHDYYAIFFMVIMSHYLYDIAEDFLFFGKTNPNWFFRKPKTDKPQFRGL